MSIKDLQEDQQPPEVQELIARMNQIQANLTTRSPLLMDALQHIHKNLAIHEELVHLLGDEGIQALHQAFEEYKGVKLIQKEEKKVKGARRKLSNDELNKGL
jgi:exonuclease VII small subunit